MGLVEVQQGVVDALYRADVATVYDYPIADVGRNLPAAVLQYQGFAQNRLSHQSYHVEWRFDLHLFIRADSKNLEGPWASLLSLTSTVLNQLRADPTLGGVCFNSIASDGEAVIQTAEEGGIHYIGHTIRIAAHEQT